MIVRKPEATFVAIAALSSFAHAEDAPRTLTGIGGGEGARVNVSRAAATIEDRGHHDALLFGGVPAGTEAFGGFKLRGNLSLEVSLRGDGEAADSSGIAGNPTTRLDINSGWTTSTVKAVGDLSLRDLLSWRRDWRLFGAVGYYRSDIDRAAVNLGTGVNEAVGDDESGLLLGTGVLYKLGFVDLRGYVQWYGVFDDHEAWDAGVAIRRSF